MFFGYFLVSNILNTRRNMKTIKVKHIKTDNLYDIATEEGKNEN